MAKVTLSSAFPCAMRDWMGMLMIKPPPSPGAIWRTAAEFACFNPVTRSLWAVDHPRDVLNAQAPDVRSRQHLVMRVNGYSRIVTLCA